MSCILFYSNYSPKCKNFMDLMGSCPVDFGESVGLTTLCIDNAEIRARIMRDGRFCIKAVPCIVTIDRDGIVNKYEGHSAFLWASEIINRIASQIKAQTPPPPKQPVVPVESSEVPVDEDNLENIQGTPVEDIATDDESEMGKPPMTLRVDSGNYEHVKLKKSDNIPENQVNTKTSKVDIMAKARAMEKSRESDIELKRPPGMPANR